MLERPLARCRHDKHSFFLAKPKWFFPHLRENSRFHSLFPFHFRVSFPLFRWRWGKAEKAFPEKLEKKEDNAKKYYLPGFHFLFAFSNTAHLKRELITRMEVTGKQKSPLEIWKGGGGVKRKKHPPISRYLVRCCLKGEQKIH